MKDKLKKFWENHNEAIAVMAGALVGGFVMGVYHQRQINAVKRITAVGSYWEGYNDAVDQVVTFDEKLFPKIFGSPHWESQELQSS